MNEFFMRAILKLDKLTVEQRRELLVSAAGEIGRLETVLDSLPDGILVCDEKHILTMANKAARRLIPLNHGEGGTLWSMVKDERIVDFFQSTLLGSERIVEKEIDVMVQGQNRLLAVSVLPLVRDHRITGSLVYVEDITEKRGREARLRRAENLASLTTLAAGVAHEIKNPLGSISIHLQLMQKALAKREGAKAPVDELLNKYLGILNEEVERLNLIVVDFLFAVRPMTLELRERDIGGIITELVQFIGPEMEQSRIRCVLDLEEGLPPLLLDERYVKQALLNLVKNAQSAMPEGGLLTIAVRRADTEVKISVTDTGSGIDTGNLAKIFEPYFTTREKGSGLGLTLVYKIIKEHRGEITVDSREGEGACFEISLPVPQKDRRLLEWNGAKERKNEM